MIWQLEGSTGTRPLHVLHSRTLYPAHVVPLLTRLNKVGDAIETCDTCEMTLSTTASV